MINCQSKRGNDAIDLADLLVQTAIGFKRFRAGSATVGGPMEIAAFTKHDDFITIETLA